MKQAWLALAAIGLASCGHLAAGPGNEAAPAAMWHEAHMALYAEEFARADTAFTRLALRHGEREEGREAIFYIGAVHLDPRNPDWNPERAETALRRYLQQDTIGTLINRRPEATTLLELARQLNLPPGERVAGLRPDTLVIRTPPVVERRVTPTAQLQDLEDENARLRQRLAERDEQIRRQREELDRIRRALTPPTPP